MLRGKPRLFLERPRERACVAVTQYFCKITCSDTGTCQVMHCCTQASFVHKIAKPVSLLAKLSLDATWALTKHLGDCFKVALAGAQALLYVNIDLVTQGIIKLVPGVKGFQIAHRGVQNCRIRCREWRLERMNRVDKRIRTLVKPDRATEKPLHLFGVPRPGVSKVNLCEMAVPPEEVLRQCVDSR